MLWLPGKRKSTNKEDERNPKKRCQDPKACHLSGSNAVLDGMMMIDGVGWMEGKWRRVRREGDAYAIMICFWAGLSPVFSSSSSNNSILDDLAVFGHGLKNPALIVLMTSSLLCK
jgi:hypothetical protein